ncbi:MAG TPA: L-lactate dehydrogenase [Acidobacteriaceae bacterium]|jgi:L-lactate dehydrogenase|nr:L-lactate dehydrogenase [Acidobacteriaceae bacterium]
MVKEGNQKIGIVGAASVGATIAYACMVRGVGRHISIFDIAKAKVEAEVLDLNHGLMFAPEATLDGSDDIAVLAGSDVVAVTAGAKQKPGQTRLDLAATNTNICRRLIPELLRVAPDALLLMVTNPVDVLTRIALQLSGLACHRVIGSGTVLDSSRFRFLLAQRCGVAVQNVHAYIAGEHGDSEIPLWSSASIGNVPLLEWNRPHILSAAERDSIFESVRTAADRVIAGKGATNYAVGLAVSGILQALLWDEGRVLPVSSLLRDYRGLNDVCLSMPAIVNRSGVDCVLPVPLSDGEHSGLMASAAAIGRVVQSLGF